MSAPRTSGSITSRSDINHCELTDNEFLEVSRLNEITDHLDAIGRVTFDDMLDDYAGQTIRENADAVRATVNERMNELISTNKKRFQKRQAEQEAA